MRIEPEQIPTRYYECNGVVIHVPNTEDSMNLLACMGFVVAFGAVLGMLGAGIFLVVGLSMPGEDDMEFAGMLI
jgi:hypothetical protein